MKKLISLLMVFAMVLSLTACGGGGSNQSAESAESQPASEPETITEDVDEPQNEDDLIEDESWEELESLGKVETENGLFFVSITVPADLVDEGMTQADIDAKAGEGYYSGVLNDDGSVTYKMTKKQHKEMLDAIAQNIEESIQELVDDPDYAFKEITYNKDFTQFDIYLETEDVGLLESFAALAFYMYGGLYGIFSGKDIDNIQVNYYSSSGELINTGNSSDMD